MKFNKTKVGKHLLMFTLLVFFALLALGSSSAKKGLEYAKKGQYEKALKEFEGDSPYAPEELFYLGKTYQALGREKDAENSYIKAWNQCVKYDSYREDFMKNYSSEYRELASMIEKIQIQREKEEAVKKFVGVWNFYTVNKDGKSYSKSNLLRYPQKVVIKENGTGYVNTPTASGEDSHSDFTWTVEGGNISTSLQGMRLGLNSQGYIVINCSAIKRNMGLERVDVFFKKE